ncbi:MAG TPA: hypothetical protein VKQ36_00555, partial [Ktedonobacterales bacterium]|nr:hypothetical protein [Ktedonobacterales bacterium]
GASVAADEGIAMGIQAAITALREAVTALLQSLARALMASLTRLIIGASAGGLTGLGVGIYTVESQHLSGWDAVLTIGGDTLTGAAGGATITTAPWALAGTAIGVGQVTTQAALGNPTDAQDAFNLISFDTLIAGSIGAPGEVETPSVDNQPTGTVWDQITPTDDMRSGTQVPRSFDIQVGDDTFSVHPNATKHMAEYLLRDGTSPLSADVRSQAILESFASSVEAAAPQLIDGRNFLTIGAWELGIDTADNVIYHARMITH